MLSLIQQYCGAPTNPLPPDRGDRISKMPRYGTAHHAAKHAENETIYVQYLNRLNGKDAAVLGKQVLMFDENKI